MSTHTATLQDLMTRNPVAVKADAPLSDAVDLLYDRAFRHLPVVDADGGLVGLLQDSDVLSRVVRTSSGLFFAPDADDLQRPAGRLVQTAPWTAAPDDLIGPSLYRLIEANNAALLVTEPSGRLVGIFTEHDGVRLAASELAEAPPVEIGQGPPFPSLGPAARLPQARELLQRLDLRHLAVTEDQRLVSVLSLRDLAMADLPGGADIPLGKLLPGRTLHSVSPTATRAQAAALMAAHRIGCLPVLDPDGRVLGMLARCDIIGWTASVLSRRTGPSSDGG